MNKLKELVKKVTSDKKRMGIAIAVIVFTIFFICGLTSSLREQRAREKALKEAELSSEDETLLNSSNDSYILSIQPDLIKSFGNLPDGYLWDLDGNLLSLGDPDMSAEEVVYAYLNGLRTLDISIAQKYSRNSSVVQTYSNYFDSTNTNTDYFDSFMRNMYKEALLSIQVEGIADNTVFAENKQVFTVNVSMLDLTSKDFWQEDKMDIYRNLYIYSSDENDSVKGEMYLYDYVLGYYRGENAVRRNTSFNITVEKYPDLGTGWLVSIDSDINDACSYSDGTLMVNYINNMYLDEGVSLMQNERQNSVDSTEE